MHECKTIKSWYYTNQQLPTPKLLYITTRIKRTGVRLSRLDFACPSTPEEIKHNSKTSVLPLNLPNLFQGCPAPSFLSLQWDSTESLCAPQIRLCPLLPLLSIVSWRTAQGCSDSVTHASRTSLSFCAVGWWGGSGEGCGQSAPG